MRLDLGPDLSAIRNAEEARIDRQAHDASEAVRPARLARMDAARLAEAKALLNQFGDDDDEPATPLLDAMPGDARREDRAFLVARLASETTARLTVIEAARLVAKARLRACSCPAAMRHIQLEIPHE